MPTVFPCKYRGSGSMVEIRFLKESSDLRKKARNTSRFSKVVNDNHTLSFNVENENIQWK